MACVNTTITTPYSAYDNISCNVSLSCGERLCPETQTTDDPVTLCQRVARRFSQLELSFGCNSQSSRWAVGFT